MAFPLTLFRHTYIIVEKDEQQNRYDVIGKTTKVGARPLHGNLYQNFLKRTQGLRIFGLLPESLTQLRYRSRRLVRLEGRDGSVAAQLYAVLESADHPQYPMATSFHMILGPNCNTFTQWVLDQVPNHNLRLPWNAWGKGYEA